MNRCIAIKHKLGRLSDLFRYDIPRFVGNIWRFRKALWLTYRFDYSGSLYYLQKHLELLEECLENGYHVDGCKNARKAKVCRLLLERILDNEEVTWMYDVKFGKGPFMLEFVPRNTEHPRRGTKLYNKINAERPDQDWQLLMKLLTKHMRGFWD